ncbi:MAG TPA: phytanoyl-CoA dioxygenase family protein [Thermoanaerobaculia bacterium]|nr:phytanoyl-CoA dioxygenase family protein [Thermoanaerobaculia bacterium]
MPRTDPLSDEETSRYRRDGYLIVRGAFSAQEMDAITQWVRSLADAPEKAGTIMKYLEDDAANPGRRILNRIENFVPYHDGFRGIATDGAIIDFVSQLMGEPACLFKDKINFKLPGGSGFEPHQDIQAGWGDYADRFVSVSVAIDETTIENGCLELAAGHHTRGLIGRLLEPMNGEELQGITFEPILQAPGDVVLFDAYTPHRSASNRTARPRRNLYLTYAKASAGDQRQRYFADKRRSFPPDSEREPGKTYSYRV